MNTFIHFIDREKELEFLRNQFERQACFAVVYGRRRVGKSELVKHFLKGKRAVYLLATQEVEKELMESFSREVAEHFGDVALKFNPFSKFVQLMEYLKEKNVEDLVLVVDEFPYLVDANKAIPSILQKYWDEYFKLKGFKVILCGSSIGAMETEVLGRKSPLYGRRTGQWKLDPLSFKNVVKFFPRVDFEKIIKFYSITGGIPLYILEFDGRKSTYENAKIAIATRGSLLYQETDIILKEELREPKTYFSLLKEVGKGKTTLNELSNALGVERTALVRYIDTLIELDLMEPVKPITAKEKSKNTLYVLKDNYFKFWFKFVYPFKKELDSFSFQGFQQNFDQNFNSYVGRQFEQVCRQAVSICNPIKASRVGGWWGFYRENNERKTIEIDIVALNESTKEILFAECKWQEKIDAGKILNALKEKSRLVQWNNENRKECFAVFAKSFKNKVKEKNVYLYDLKDLKKTFERRG